MNTAIRFALVAVLAFVLPACLHPSHEDADTSTQRTSRTGLYVVTYEPSVQPVPKRALHDWTLRVRTQDGRPVTDAEIKVDGGMPDHGHGLPTQPALREALGEGAYVIEGMKFNMGGYWVVDFSISSSEGADDVRFELNL